MSQFLKFCVVGAAGFLVDAGVLQLLIASGTANPYVGRIASFLAAASVTWALNRRFTFKVASVPSRSEWLRYMGFMLLGAAVNYAAFAIAIYSNDIARAHPWLGVAVGSVAGLSVNYLNSRLYVFRSA